MPFFAHSTIAMISSSFRGALAMPSERQMTSPTRDIDDDASDQIDLDRLAVDIDYRRALIRRLKAESASRPERGEGPSPHKD